MPIGVRFVVPGGFGEWRFYKLPPDAAAFLINKARRLASHGTSDRFRRWWLEYYVLLGLRGDVRLLKESFVL